MKRLFAFFIFAITINIFISSAYSQPGIAWQKSLGGEEAVSIDHTKSGGYIVAGNYWGVGYDSTTCDKQDSGSAWVARLDGNGSTIWRRCYGGLHPDGVASIVQTKDGGAIFCGWTTGLVSEGAIYHGNYDAWAVKLDSLGNIQWQYTYGGSDYDMAQSIVQTFDGGYAFAGWTFSTNGDVTGNHGADDYWIVKLNSSGQIVWQKCLGGSNYDYANSITEAADSGLVITGTSSSNDDNVKGNHGYKDMWIVKIKADTSIAWQTCVGGAGDDGGVTICRINDGSYISVGNTQSYFLNDNYHGGDDFYTVKINDSGKVISQICYGGGQDDDVLSVTPTSDGGYFIGGQSNSSDGDVGRLGSNFQDAWVVKCDVSGNLEWQKSLGGRWDETAFSVLQSYDGGYVFAGRCSSNNGDVTTNTHGDGGWNSWIVRLSDDASVFTPSIIDNSNLKITPNPASSEVNIYCSSSSSSKAQIEIYDILGNRIFQTNDMNTSIGERQMKLDVSKFPEGMYMLKMQSGSEISTEKFVIIK